MTEQDDTLYTIEEVARRLRVDDTTVRRWIREGALDAVTLPMYHSTGKKRCLCRYRVKQSTLNRLLTTPAQRGT